MTGDFPLKDETHQILGACFEVYNTMGTGYLESVYQECLEIELATRKIPYRAQESLSLRFKGRELNRTFAPDLLCFDKIIVELKAVRLLLPEHRAQLIHYLKATSLEVGLLVNFGTYPKIEYERIVNQKNVAGSMR
jgi:GxxExxY protein